MGVNFNLNENILYSKSNREYKEFSKKDLEKENQRIQNDKTVYQDITETDSNGSKRVLKAVTFRDPKNPSELITVRLTEENINNLKEKFGEDKFIKRDNGTIRLMADAEEFVGNWFEDIKYNRSFDNKGADFDIEYEYLDKKLGGKISSISVKMNNQYLSLGKMKTLANQITETELKGLTEEQKKSIENEVKVANIMTEYFKKYISIFEADGSKNLTDELNTTLRIDGNFDGQIDLNENFQRKEGSKLTTQSFFTSLVKDFNDKYSNEEFAKRDFEGDKDIDFMSFADKENLLEKIKKMQNENTGVKDEKDSSNQENGLNSKQETIKEVGANVTAGQSAIETNWQLAIDLLFANHKIEETSKKIDNEETKKQNEIRDEMDKNLGKLFKNNGFEESKGILEGIVNTYNNLYRDVEIENFTKTLHDDYNSLEEYELDSNYNVNYNTYLGAKEFLIKAKEYQTKMDYSDYYVTTREFKKEFFDNFKDAKAVYKNEGTNTPYLFGRNFVKAKSAPTYRMEAKFKNVRDKMMNVEVKNEHEQRKKDLELQMLNTIIDTFSKF